MRIAPRAALGLAAAAGLLAACAGLRPEPVLEASRFTTPEGRFDRVCVVPFEAAPRVARDAPEGEAEAEDVRTRVGRFLAEALQTRGVTVIPPSDLARVFTAAGRPVPELDPYGAAEIAAQEFGANAVLLGRVDRFREREGEALGSLRPASVAFTVTLYSAPAGRRIWTARFDETQKALSENLFNLPRYPGGGTRWLTAAELARWGAERVAEEIPLSP